MENMLVSQKYFYFNKFKTGKYKRSDGIIQEIDFDVS